MWSRHSADWRDTAQVSSQWREAEGTDPRLLEARASQGWWATLERLGITLLVTREYEHLVLALSVSKGRPRTTFFPMPHPSGLTVDRQAGKVYIASTRNPNQVYTFKPLASQLERSDLKLPAADGIPLMPATASYYPGSLYIHALWRSGRSAVSCTPMRSDIAMPWWRTVLAREQLLRARVVAEVHRGLQPQSDSAQLDCRGQNAGAIVLLGVVSRGRQAAARTLELSGGRARRHLLGSDPTADLQRPHATALGASAQGRGVGGQQRLWRSGFRRGRAAAGGEQATGMDTRPLHPRRHGFRGDFAHYPEVRPLRAGPGCRVEYLCGACDIL